MSNFENRDLLDSATMKDEYALWLLENYPSMWKYSISDCRSDDDSAALWMLYSSAYLFRTAGVRWTVDPVYSEWSLENPLSAADDLDFLDLVLLTHEHADHCDLPLISRLCRRKELTLVVPSHLEERVLGNAEIVNCDFRVVSPGDIIIVKGLKATAFDSLHFDENPQPGDPVGCEETGWLVEVDDRRLLFPGDIRNYSLWCDLPDFGAIDFLFAHLWLGRRKAMTFTDSDLNSFAKFVASFRAQNVFLAHLCEISRVPEDYWTLKHAELAADRISTISPGTETTPLVTGRRINLW
jgi:L-ascorbate metabolism protein UlaG (beta-lactamase superfamily)